MQTDALNLIRIGQIVYIENSIGQSCPFGVDTILSRKLVVCQPLNKKPIQMKIDSSDMATIVLPEEDGAYLVKAVVEEKNELKRKLILRPTEEVSHVQRRQYFRLSKPPASAQLQLVDKDCDESTGPPSDAEVLDISGGGIGLCIRCTKLVSTGCMVKLKLSLSDELSIETLGDVVRVALKSILKNEYQLGINFTNIRESDRGKILKFITQEQLARRKAKKE